jgi:hypothetical protein
MASHIKILGILHIILSALGLLAAVLCLMLLGGFAALSSISDQAADHNAAPMLGIIGVAAFVFLIIISVPGLVGGIGLVKFAPWSRVLMIVISCIDLINIPFGLALGIYGLWVLTKPESVGLLSRGGYQPVVY